MRQKHTFTLQELRVYSDVVTRFPRILWECQWSRAMCILTQKMRVLAGRSMAKNFWTYKWGTVPVFLEFCLFCKTVCHPVQRWNWRIILFWAKSKTLDCLLMPASFTIGTRGYFPGLKQSSNEVYHSSPPSTSVKNEFSYNSTPPVCLQASTEINFTFRYPQNNMYIFQMLVLLSLLEPVLRVLISRVLWLMEYCVEFPSVSCVIRFVRCGCM